MAATGFTPIQIYYSTTASAVPTAGNLLPGELALNIADMKLYCENSSGVVTLLASAAGSSGDVVGPASSTDNAVVRFDGTTGKLVQNSSVTIADDGTTVISTNSASDALRITQTGAGNALVVEDSTNPDSTPFVVDANGRAIAGYTTAITAAGSLSPFVQSIQTSQNGGFFAGSYVANSGGPNLIFGKSRSATVGTPTVVQSGDSLGWVRFQGDDGTNLIEAASITATVDGTPGTNDMPGRLVFSTTADGASTPTERMRITSAGRVGIGITAPTVALDVLGTIEAQVALTQDAVALQGRAGGTSSFVATITPTTLTASRTVTIPDENFTVGFRNVPPVGAKTSSYILATGDVGKYVEVGSGGSITIPDATFASGDVVSIFNNTSGSITITCTITTAYIAGTDADKATVSLATRGVATLLFISGTVCVITGNVS